MMRAVVLAAVLGAMGAACGGPAPTAEQADAPGRPTEMPLDNAQYSILEMATAHGAFTLEVEVDADADTTTIARQLVEPIQDQYAEVLVYFYDRAGDGELPMRRVQWTEGQGYSEVDYE